MNKEQNYEVKMLDEDISKLSKLVEEQKAANKKLEEFQNNNPLLNGSLLEMVKQIFPKE